MKSKFAFLGLSVAAILLVNSGVMTYYSIRWLLRSIDSAGETQLTLLHLEKVLSNVKELESGERGFLLTGNVRDVQQAQESLRGVDAELENVRQLVKDNARERMALGRAEAAISEIVASVDLKLAADEPASTTIALINKRNALLNEVTRGIRQIGAIENAQFEAQQSDVRAHALRTMWASAVSGALTLSLLLITMVILRRQLAERIKARNAMAEANKALTERMNDLQKRSHEIQLLSDMSEVLQVSASLEETGEVLPMFMQQLFPSCSGAVYSLRSSRNLLESVAAWGSGAMEDSFAPHDCWALRKGRVHISTGSVALVCNHIAHEPGSVSLCIPMVAQGDAIGIFHLRVPDGVPAGSELQFSAKAVADQISLALANLRLQETLRTRAVRDPLTGLFNRRYLEESFDRELRRAQRNHTEVGVMMMDIDHFKRFNDTFGHPGGDALLQQFAHMMQAMFRDEDILCRYGGEEFAVMMPETTEATLRQRAEELREAAKNMHVRFNGQSLGTITISIGIAVSAGSGNTIESVIAAADQALYQAKHGGRDRVVSASNRTELRVVNEVSA